MSDPSVASVPALQVCLDMARAGTIVALAFGTLGDVIPVAVLVASLAKARQKGSVFFITHAAHEKFLCRPLAAAGVAFRKVSTQPVVSASQIHEAEEEVGGGWRASLDSEHRRECLEAVDDIVALGGAGLQLIIFNFFALEGWHLAELYGVPCAVAAPYVVPYSAPAAFERNFRYSHPQLYRRLKQGTHGEIGWPEVLHWMWPLFSERWVTWRTESLQMSPYPLTDPVTALPISQSWPEAPPLLYGFSEEVVECPGYWPRSVHVCGFWLAPIEWWTHTSSEIVEGSHEVAAPPMHSDLLASKFTPPVKLLRFLEDIRDHEGNKCQPIFFGMSCIGSLGLLKKPESMLRVLRQVLEASGQHMILFTSAHSPLDSVIMATAESVADTEGSSKSTPVQGSNMDDGIVLFGGQLLCYSGFVPYTWLFPKCLLAFHHGGSGTTAAALVSGIPQIICPFILDQFYWAERMAWIGVSPAPVKPCRLFPEEDDFEEAATTIVNAVREAASPRKQAFAAALAQRLQKEDGVAVGVSILERKLEGRE